MDGTRRLLVFCTSCGTKLKDGAAFCTSCGSRVRIRTENSPATPAAIQPSGLRTPTKPTSQLPREPPRPTQGPKPALTGVQEDAKTAPRLIAQGIKEMRKKGRAAAAMAEETISSGRKIAQDAASSMSGTVVSPSRDLGPAPAQTVSGESSNGVRRRRTTTSELQQIASWNERSGLAKATKWFTGLLILVGFLSILGVAPIAMSLFVILLMILSLTLSIVYRNIRKSIREGGSTAYTLEVEGYARLGEARNGDNPYVSIAGLKFYASKNELAQLTLKPTTSLTCVVLKPGLSLILTEGGRSLSSPLSVGVKGL